MQLAEYLPKIAKKHRIIQLLCKMGLQEKICKIKFNQKAVAFIDLMDPEPRNAFIRESFEPAFFELAKAFMPDNGVFFDLGANVGLCTFGMLPAKPKCNYHLFEANPKMIELLSHSIKYHTANSIKLSHACVTEEEGITEFCLSNKQSGQSHVATIEEYGVKIPNLSLDNYCIENNISKIDFAKIDLEGHEVPALKGWNKCLSKRIVKTVYLEIIPENQSRYGLNTIDPLLYMESHGYELYLCKEEDLGSFGQDPKFLPNRNSKLKPLASKFLAKQYPNDFATDVLALAPV